jgi:hypothetical protein
MSDNRLPFYLCCCDWPKSDVPALMDMIETSFDVSRRTFLANVDRRDLDMLERNLLYEKHPSQGLTMAGDWHVSYHRSKLHGKRVYYFRHSSIEYVFHRP